MTIVISLSMFIIVLTMILHNRLVIKIPLNFSSNQSSHFGGET